MKAYSHAVIFDGDQFLKNKTLITKAGKIAGLSDRVPEGIKTVDCKGCYLVPGLIDLQVYGGGGYLFSTELSAEALQIIADDLVSKGTTGFYITLATNGFEVFKRAVEIVKNHAHPAVLGVHLEGPYMNPLKKGAHLERYLKKPDNEELKKFLEFSEGTVKMMTLAPEQCSPETVRLLTAHNVLVSAGHSNATFQEARSGLSWGIRAATHLYNAMSALHHREPGLPGAVFQSEVCASIIADGIHVDFEMVKIAKKLMGERLFFITDAIEEVRKGEYVHIRQKDRFTLPDGTLSGSALTMPLAVKNGVQKVGLTLRESLRMASLYPARLVGMEDRGRIKKGFPAYFTALSPDLELKFNVVDGKTYPAEI